MSSATHGVQEEVGHLPKIHKIPQAALQDVCDSFPSILMEGMMMSTQETWDVILCQMPGADCKSVQGWGRVVSDNCPGIHGIIWDLHEGATDLAIAIFPQSESSYPCDAWSFACRS